MSQTVVVAGEPLSKTNGRYLLVDALRGVAAVMVVLFHALTLTVMEVPLRAAMPQWVASVLTFGSNGVYVFFVISGFVIAHSIRQMTPDWRGSGNFILRRQIRLDPPYYLLILLTLLDLVLENHIPGLAYRDIGRPWEWIANLFYVQNILHVEQIVLVAWTLCLEVQFYLLFMLATAVGYACWPGRQNPSGLAKGLVWGSGVICLVLPLFNAGFASSPWFWSCWGYFALGVLCHWATHRLLPQWALGVYAAVMATVMCVTGSSRMMVALSTAALLYCGGQLGTLRTWGRSGILQYLGRLSYSLYLVHILVVTTVLRGGFKITHYARAPALGWFLLAGVLSVLVADGFHRLIEVPSMRWSARLKFALRPRTESAATTKPTVLNSETVSRDTAALLRL